MTLTEAASLQCSDCRVTQPGFFERLGFTKVDKSVLPHKIWTDCLKCVKFPDCDEIAVVKELK